MDVFLKIWNIFCVYSGVGWWIITPQLFFTRKLCCTAVWS